MAALMMWFRLAAILTVFVGSCTGLGYLAGWFVRRFALPRWLMVPITILIASIWPAILFADVTYAARQYQPRGPSDPADAPALLVMSAVFVGLPTLFALSVPLAMLGYRLSRRKTLLRSNTAEKIVGREPRKAKAKLKR